MGAAINILILNSVPYNTGDQALLECTEWLLRTIWPKSKIKIACQFPAHASSLVSELDFIHEPFSARYISNGSVKDKTIQTLNKVIRRVGISGILHLPFHTRAEREFYDSAEQADLIISSAGGYFHDFYDFSHRIRLIRHLQRAGKKTLLMAQSIGPFWKKNSKAKISSVITNADLVLLREPISASHISFIPSKKTHITGDLSFLLLEKYKIKTSGLDKINPLKFAISIRAWKDKSETESIVHKMITLISYLSKIISPIEVHFISTCQGLNYYIDDSILSNRIISELNSANVRFVSDTGHFSPFEMICKFKQFDAFIGMRMHAALFAIMSGIPALCIGYEDKSKGVFSALGIKDFEFHYSESEDTWKKKLKNFIFQYQNYRDSIPKINNKGITLARKNMDYLKELEL